MKINWSVLSSQNFRLESFYTFTVATAIA